MDKLQQVLGSFGKRPKSSESTNKKRKWREIEQIKEREKLTVLNEKYQKENALLQLNQLKKQI